MTTMTDDECMAWLAPHEQSAEAGHWTTLRSLAETRRALDESVATYEHDGGCGVCAAAAVIWDSRSGRNVLRPDAVAGPRGMHAPGCYFLTMPRPR